MILKWALPILLAISSGEAPIGAIRFTSTPNSTRILSISVMSSLCRKPKAAGPRILQDIFFDLTTGLANFLTI